MAQPFTPPPERPTRAVLYRLGSVFITTVWAVLLRYAGEDLPVGQLIFFRSIIPVFLLLGFYLWRGQLSTALYTARPLGHVVRGISGIISMGTYIAALVRIPLMDLTILSYSTPLITVGLAALFLKERVRIYRWSAVFIGFAGVLIMLWPYLSLERLLGTAAIFGAFLALVSAFTSATAAIQVRHLISTESTSSIVFYFYLFCTVGAGLSLPFAWVTPNAMQWIALIGVGVLGTISHVLSAESYRNAPASMTASLDYTAILFAFIFGYFIFGELPGLQVYIGGAVIVASGLFIILWERRLR
ncbi:MAG: DMT family transporter [Pseudorhodoplanes sp.]